MILTYVVYLWNTQYRGGGTMEIGLNNVSGVIWALIFWACDCQELHLNDTFRPTGKVHFLYIIHLFPLVTWTKNGYELSSSKYCMTKNKCSYAMLVNCGISHWNDCRTAELEFLISRFYWAASPFNFQGFSFLRHRTDFDWSNQFQADLTDFVM